MRIALFTETYVPHINGVVTHVKSLKNGLEKLGHTVLVVTADGDTWRHYISDGVLHCPAHTSQRFYGFGVAMPLSSSRLRYIKNFRPDVIHVHQEFGIGASGMMIAKVLGVPLVYTLHTMYDEYIYYVAPELLVPMTTRLSHQYIRMLASAAQALTGPSKKCEEYLRIAGVRKPVMVIPNPVDLDMFDLSKISEEKAREFREKFGYTEDMLIGIFVGRLGREKSVDLLLKYWKETILPEENMRLIIVGDGPCKDELSTQANALGIADMVTFAGKVPHEDIPPYYAACDFYITASTSDTNSISMLEGMATELPVLQIVDPLNEGQVRDGENGFIFHDAADMADKLRALRQLPPEQLAELHRSVRRSVEHSGDVNLAQNVMNAYEKAIRMLRRRRLSSYGVRGRGFKIHIKQGDEHHE